MKEWFSAKELAEFNLPTLPNTERGVQTKAARENWLSRPRCGRGGGKEYNVSSLPAKAKEELARRSLANVPERRSKAVIERPDDADLSEAKAWQRETAEARAAILDAIDNLAVTCGKNNAIKAVLNGLKNGTLEPSFVELIRKANAKTGGTVKLSRASLFNWYKLRETAGLKGLMPTPAKDEQIIAPQWFEAFARLYFRPQKPSLMSCIEIMQENLPHLAPSYRQAKFYLEKIGKLLANKGRVGAREGKAFRAYVSRDVSHLWPGAIYCADGHTFDAEIAHPIHGKPFRPEVTTIIDVYTRKAVGFSLNIVESTASVMDSLIHAVTTNGIPDVFYVDNGNGFNNTTVDMFCARLGITKKNSIAYNSQARGVIERLHQTIWVKAAKMLPTYMGKPMDPEAKQKVFHINRREVKQDGRSRLLPDWRGFVAYCERCFAAYNDHPHSFLPVIIDSETGKKRHMTPNEAWEAGNPEFPDYRPDVLTPAETDDLSRPYVIRKCSRCLVSLFNNVYGSHLLTHYHDEQVAVGFDIHDASKVWVREWDGKLPGRLICVARFEENKRAFMPVSYDEKKKLQRAQGRLARLDEQQKEVLEELGNRYLPAPEAAPVTAEEAAKNEEFLKEFEAEQNAQSVADIDTPAARFRKAVAIGQQIKNGESISAEDRRWFTEYSKSPEYIQRMDFAQDFGMDAALTA